MEVSAKASYIRISPRKVRLVIDVIRGLDVAQAREQLRFMNKAAARPVMKLLDSAVANAEHNFHFLADRLFVKRIVADMGPTLHRWTPKAFGRSAPIRKRTSHVAIALAERASQPEVPRRKRPAKSGARLTPQK
ncbi:50S ribosomal protein L22 [Candidatus Uhrbacteria bacterium]|nr:50S ribosomal protein L22 [Candidatus Uhrbacteria bacterium]